MSQVMTADACRAAHAQGYVDGLTVGLVIMLLIACAIACVAVEALAELRRIRRDHPTVGLRFSLWASEDS